MILRRLNMTITPRVSLRGVKVTYNHGLVCQTCALRMGKWHCILSSQNYLTSRKASIILGLVRRSSTSPEIVETYSCFALRLERPIYVN